MIITKFKIVCKLVACLCMLAWLFSCKKGAVSNPNAPTMDEITRNPTIGELNNLITGTEAAMRQYLDVYLDMVSIFGREYYRFSQAEPRYTSDLLGGGNATLDRTSFYSNNSWLGRYNTIRNAYLLLAGANNSTYITDKQRRGYTSFAKTVIAYQLSLNLNQTYANGIRIDVKDFDQLGPIVTKEAALTGILSFLNDAKADLADAEFLFSLSSGFTGFKDAAGFLKFNRAIAARIYTYNSEWDKAADALAASFFNPNGDFATGVYHVYSNSAGDELNPVYIAQDKTGEIRVAHPSFITGISANDDRIAKATLRAKTAEAAELASDYDYWVYRTNNAPIAIVRNEELILMYAEIEAQLNHFNNSRDAINVIRGKHQLADYSGALSKDALINEMLQQKRYSLFGEGFRWVDLRRYNKLNTLPVDRAGDKIWEQTPLPFSEQ